MLCVVGYFFLLVVFWVFVVCGLSCCPLFVVLCLLRGVACHVSMFLVVCLLLAVCCLLWIDVWRSLGVVV